MAKRQRTGSSPVKSTMPALLLLIPPVEKAEKSEPSLRCCALSSGYGFACSARSLGLVMRISVFCGFLDTVNRPNTSHRLDLLKQQNIRRSVNADCYHMPFRLTTANCVACRCSQCLSSVQTLLRKPKPHMSAAGPPRKTGQSGAGMTLHYVVLGASLLPQLD
eukprot:2213339-Amphidinium_carterae.1